MRARSLLILISLTIGYLVSVAGAPAAADIEGRYRIILMNRGRVEGDVKELADAYEVRTKYGAIVTVKKSEVLELIPLEPVESAATPAATGAAKPAKPQVTDEELAELWGDIELETDAFAEPALDIHAQISVSQASIDEMVRIAGRESKKIETDHFALVYTSDAEQARGLASRLESVYRWCVKFMEMVNLPSRPHDYKLEIYYFKTHEEFKGYGSNLGGIPDWAGGFYQHEYNRSAFFDGNTLPQIVALREALKGAPYEERRRIGARIKRALDSYNLRVIQHEAAHHVHFNIGIFNERGDNPTWLVEGLAQMFESPPGKLGASLGTTNHYRLAQFQSTYNPKVGGGKERLVELRRFVIDDSTWDMDKYPYGWALVHFLWKEHREGFTKFMQRIAAREDGVELNLTDRQREFEDCFDVSLDKEFEDAFLKYIFEIPFRKSALEP